MQWMSLLPIEEFALRLKERADTTSGIEGAIAGVGMAVVQEIIRSQNREAPFDVKTFIAVLAAGSAYGFLERR